MKNLTIACICFLSMGVFASNTLGDVLETSLENPHILASTSPTGTASHGHSISKEFEKAAKRDGIAHRKINAQKGIKEGYYVISGVFGNELNAKKSVKNLNKKGFNSNYFNLAEADLNYVYLKRFSRWQQALSASSSQFNGLYTDTVWIMVVENVKRQGKLSSNFTSMDQNPSPKSVSTSVLKSVANNDETFEEAAEKNNITYRVFSNLIPTPSGYYIIAGTFSKERNRDKAIKRLKKKRLQLRFGQKSRKRFKLRLS